MDYWKSEAGLSGIRFIKTQIIEGKHKKHRLSNGVCYLNVSSSYLKRKINVWIKLLADKLLDDELKKV